MRAPSVEPAAAPARAEPTPTEIVLAYHQTTKHHYHRYARSLGYLDWDTQPDPFRRFEGAELVHLPFGREDESPSYASLARAGAVAPRALDARAVGTFFELGLGLTAWKEFQGSRWSLRANPSSGNLHPTEGYAVLPGGALKATAGEDWWVAHYAPAEHALEVRARLDVSRGRAALAGFPAGSFLVGLTSIHWREAWKYGERAYRYCHHDTGHAWAALGLAAASLGWRLALLEDLGDDDVARLLGTDRVDEFHEHEREEADGIAVVITAGGEVAVPLGLDPEAIASAAAEAHWSGRANILSPEHADWNVIEIAARAAAKPRTEVRIRTLPASSPIADDTAGAPTARRIILQRRSAVDLDGKTRLGADAFFHLLGRLLPARADGAASPPPWDAIGWEPRVHLALFVHRVDGLAPGLYALPRKESAAEALRAAMKSDFRWARPADAPADLPLFLLREQDCVGLAKSVSCGQDIAGDGVASLGMIAELDATVREVGPWAYRRLHWEAGMIGQVLYLEAESAGIRGTGIGCFFDDAVHETLGLAGTRFHTIYHFTFGGPVDDPRLSTLPPYSAERIEREP